MHRFRRLRGLLGMALVWGIAWIPLGILVSVIDAWTHDRPVALGASLSDAPFVGIVGAVCGFLFGLTFALLERRRTFADLSLWRFVAWGVGGAVIIPIVAIIANPFGITVRGAGAGLTIYAILGGVSAGATLAIARRAPESLSERSFESLPRSS